MTSQELPTGIVTFLFSDIEASTRLWEEVPEEAMRVLARHDEIIESEVAAKRGVIVRPRGEGDSRFAVFEQARDAVTAAAAIQAQFFGEEWAIPWPLRIRIAMHTGTADLRMGDYYGLAVNRCARLRSIAHGGQTLLSQATWELVHNALPEGASLRDEGQHRLKDLTHPEHVYQLILEEWPQDFPPLRSLSAVPNNLPIVLTEFVGREEALRDIRRSFDRTRLLTLVGPGGNGKSRLAIETAAKMADQFRHGIYFVSLAPIPTAEAVPQAIAEAIGLSLASNEEPRRQLLNYLRSKRQLLLLDNFEHVIDAAGLVDEILRGAPEVKIMATSRTKLNLSGETVFTVPGLHVHSWNSKESFAKNEAVQLFVASARHAKPDFKIDHGDVRPLQRILALVQGSPLGILLAASWVDLLPVSEIADEIARNFDFLETGMRNVPARQRSVRAVFDYSWQLLEQSERELFATLSVFRGGFTRQAAQKVAGAALRQLANLANKSFLTTNPESGRYTVHELLRQYGEEALRENGSRYKSAKAAHDLYYAAFMEQAWSRILHNEQREALLDIEADIENVRTAWRHLVAQGDPADALRMVRSLWFIHEIRGWHVAADEIFAEAITYGSRWPFSDALRLLVAMSESARSWFVALLGRPEEGAALAERSINTLRELGFADELALAYIQIFMSLYLSVQPGRMKEIGQEALASCNDPWIKINVHNWLSYIASIEGRYAEQDAHLAQVEDLIGTTQDYWVRYWLHLSRALTALKLSDFAACRHILEHALANARIINLRRGIHHTLYNLGITARAMGDRDSAWVYLVESVQLSEELGGSTDLVSALVDLAITLSEAGQTERALEMAATAFAHPLSVQITVWNTEPIRSRAEALRAALEGAIAPDAAEAAWQRGLTADFDALAASLIEGSYRLQVTINQ